MKRFFRWHVDLVLCALAMASARAGVVVTQNVAPGATSWLGAPILASVSNPSGQTAVPESFNSVGGCTSYTETFTVDADYTLQTISIYAGGGTGTSVSAPVTLRLFDLGTQTAPNPSAYSAGTDLFNSGNGLAITYSAQSYGVLQFDFTGADQVALQAGHLYAFEINGVANTSPLSWQRTISDTYSGGAAYRNRSWINGMNARDFALAVYGTTMITTNTPWPVPDGVVYHVFSTPDQGVNLEGANPASALVVAGGVLFGTTVNGGQHGVGTAFRLNPDATDFSAFRSFAGSPDAANGSSDWIVSGETFFGASAGGGADGVGTLFGIRTNGAVSVIQSFSSVDPHTATNSTGASPAGQLALSGTTIFGVTPAGGAAGNGVVFSAAANGSAYSVLCDFSALNSTTGTNTDGAMPWGGLILVGDTLFGTASGGGDGGSGVVFSMKTNGEDFATVHSFDAMDPLTGTNQDGAIPLASLAFSGGRLFGTTAAGGFGNSGTVFSIGTNGGDFQVLHQFSRVADAGTNADGARPAAALTALGGMLFGTASSGGAGAAGSVFCLNTNGSGFKTIHAFTAMDFAAGTNMDGAFPVAGVLVLSNSVWGTTFGGGPGGAGTVFQIPLPLPSAIITDIVPNPNRTVTLSFSGIAHATNILQAATNLAPADWMNISTNTADGAGLWQVTDTNADLIPLRFYRSYTP